MADSRRMGGLYLQCRSSADVTILMISYIFLMRNTTNSALMPIPSQPRRWLFQRMAGQSRMGGDAAVGNDDAPGHERGVVRSQEKHDLGNLLGPADAANRMAFVVKLAHALGIAGIGDKAIEDRGRGHHPG